MKGTMVCSVRPVGAYQALFTGRLVGRLQRAGWCAAFLVVDERFCGNWVWRKGRYHRQSPRRSQWDWPVLMGTVCTKQLDGRDIHGGI